LTRALLAFAAMAGTPASAFICMPGNLILFTVFPLAGLITGGAAYLKRFAALCMPPAASLGWALIASPEAVTPSLRWLAAASGGSYFAWVLGSGGTAMVIDGIVRRAPLLRRPLEPLLVSLQLAGPSAALTRVAWSETGTEGSFARRVAMVAERVLREARPEVRKVSVSLPGTVLAGLGWAMLSLSVAGFL
jgi:hypothetical protein